MSVIAIQIVDFRAGKPGKPVDAELYVEVTLDELIAAEKSWKLKRMEAVHELLKKGVPEEEIPLHWHWDWAEVKAPELTLLANRVLGVQCEGTWQGLVMTTTVGHVAQLAPDVGKPLVYVKYIESAPWNVGAMTATPVFGAVGTRLMEAVVRQSLDEGFHGRVGLHSLPTPATEKFYQGKGFKRLGIDMAVEGLPYYELSREAAARFLSGGKP